MSSFPVKKYKDLLNDMVSWLVANQNKITDFNEGSGIRTILEVISQMGEQIYIRGHIGFTEGLKAVPFYAFNFEKDPASYAAGEVIF